MFTLVRQFVFSASCCAAIGVVLSSCAIAPVPQGVDDASRPAFLDEAGLLVPSEDAAFSAWLINNVGDRVMRVCISNRVRTEGWALDEAIEDCNNRPR